MIDALRTALAARADQHRDELRRLVEIPSVSAHRTAIDEAAALVVELLRSRDISAEAIPTAGHPVVVGRGGATGPDVPTLLFYVHYDVQPPDPLDGWSAPPFELTERDGRMYGRGVADTKGHIVCRLAAIDAVRDVFGGDDVGYVFVVEGEEEVGSPNFESFVREHAADLAADACIWESGGVGESGRPAVTLGLKGVVSLELHARGPSYDAHSSLGVVIDNPLWRLSAAIASLRDADGHVTVDGFYDDVEPLTEADLAALAAEPDRTSDLRERYGVPRFLGAAEGVELMRRLRAEPCVNVNGIHGGYGGPGGKTVLPAEGSAKLDVRLVPRQDPATIMKLIRAHLERAGFGDVEVVELAGEAAGRTRLDDPFVALVAGAARDVYGMEPVIQLSSPGSGPAGPFREILDVPLASSGCAYPGCRAHAPDEHVRIEDFENAKLHSAAIVARFGGR